MCFKHFNMSLALIFCTVVSCWGDQKIETQIGHFNLAGSPITESKFVSEFGQGYLKMDKVGDKTLAQRRIYYASDEEVWVEIHFSHVLNERLERVLEGILVTKKKLCDESFKPKRLFGPLKTSRRIGIGDSLNKVLETYGKPTISIDIGRDKLFSVLLEELKFQEGCIFRYLTTESDELFFTEFYFKGKELHSILISGSE